VGGGWLRWQFSPGRSGEAALSRRRGTIQGLDQAGVEAASGEGSSRVTQEENRVRGAPYAGRHPLASRAGNPTSVWRPKTSPAPPNSTLISELSFGHLSNTCLQFGRNLWW
jgi:hypothetical protein